MAKKFFYVCAGSCLLAIAYQLGAGKATAQSSTQVYGNIDVANVTYITGGTLYGVHLNYYTGIDGPPSSIPLPHPGTVVAATCTVSGSPGVPNAFVTYEDGIVWEYRPETGWVTVTSMTGETPTAVHGSTWGQVKSTYHR